jgi:hypothetical protein
MHVMIHPVGRLFSAVAFELNGTVLEPHELLQHDDRWLDPPTSCQVMFPELIDLKRFAARWMGVRGLVWAESGQILTDAARAMADCEIPPPWNPRQQMELRSAVWMAAKVARESFGIPAFDGVGLSDKPLHIATRNAVILQAAYRAMLVARVT